MILLLSVKLLRLWQSVVELSAVTSLPVGKVTLRHLTPEDVTKRYVDWMNDAKVVKFTEQRYFRHSLKDVRTFVAEKLESKSEQLFGIFLDRVHVGNIKVGPVDYRNGSAFLSYFLGDRSCWGSGIATASVLTLTDFCFDKMGLFKLCAGCNELNFASIKVLEKAGFTVEARLPLQLVFDGQRVDQLLFGRLA